MAIANQVTPSAESQALIVKYAKSCMDNYAGTYNTRERLEEADRTYMREVDFSPERMKAEIVKRKGDITKFQNVVIPVALPQVESAVTFQSEMFLSGFPLFGVVSDPVNQDAAVAMDTIIGDQQLRGGWVLEFQKAFRDGFKYNLLGMCTDWVRERTYAVAPTQVEATTQLTEVLWEGNQIKKLDLYNTFYDASVNPADISRDGEYGGYLELKTGVAMKRYLQNTLGTFNVKQALQSIMNVGIAGQTTPTTYYFPQLNPSALIRSESLSSTNWVAFWQGTGSRDSILPQLYKSRYQVTTLYCRICPADFKMFRVPSPTVPQLWKFVIVNNAVVVLAEQLTNAHDKLPLVFAQPLDDGLGYQTKSLQKNVEPMQEIVTAFANSSIQSRRRAISDRGLYDPQRISARDINADSPTAKIPVRTNAFGGKVSDAYYPLPFEDGQFQINASEMNMYLGYADVVTGMNQARQGQFTKGNRTRAEFSSIMAYGSGRDRSISQALECSLMQPIKEILKANVLQFQGGVSLFNPERQQLVEVDPVKLRKAMLVFKLSDGLLPSERIMDSESLTLALQTLQSVPQLAQGYNVIPMFSYIMKMRGAKLKPFEKSPEQLAFEQAMQQWQQAVMAAGQQIAEAIQKAGPDSGIDAEALMQQIQSQVPPQPKPEDYGYNPQVATQGEDARSVFAQTQVE